MSSTPPHVLSVSHAAPLMVLRGGRASGSGRVDDRGRRRDDNYDHRAARGHLYDINDIDNVDHFDHLYHYDGGAVLPTSDGHGSGGVLGWGRGLSADFDPGGDDPRRAAAVMFVAVCLVCAAAVGFVGAVAVLAHLFELSAARP